MDKPAKPILLSIILIFATDNQIRGKSFDMTVKYPFEREYLNFEKHQVPHTLLVALAGKGISFEDCEATYFNVKSRLKELGAKIIDQYEVKYCCFLNPEDNGLMCTYELEYPMKD